MPRLAKDDGLDKFQRYRASRKARGMKLLRVWVPDPLAPGFKAEAERQARLLRGAPEEAEALDVIEALAEWGPDSE
ncbi:antitoxin MazE-like protein [Gluconobacter oxydans]|uniref:antitoxin MazE-like protein n=1 Tax=Gluconobacter oxydans TaxID=442 RepID=UPI0039EA3295